MGWEPGTGGRAGDEPGSGPDVAGTPEAVGDAGHETLLAGFAPGGQWAACAPGPELAAVLAAVSGPEWRCPGAAPDELVGVLRRWAALQSWAAAGMLGTIRQMIRDDDIPGLARARHGDLPDQWSDSVNHELALALASSATSAERTALLAWELGARLPGIARLLADGTITQPKARLIAETFQFLSDEDAARAEAMLIPQLTGATGKTFAQIVNLTARITVQVDPSAAERRRKAAERHLSRVTLFRESSGAAGLSGHDLPSDEALAAFANVSARAEEYKESGTFPGARQGQLLAAAYLDLLDGTPAWARIASGRLPGEEPGDEPGSHLGDSDPGPGDPGPGDNGPGGARPGDNGPRDTGNGDSPAASPRLQELTLPLATLLRIAERPGEGYGFGILDPDLCRRLAAIAAGSGYTEVCVTVTAPDGIAIGHGCARRGKPGPAISRAPGPPGGPPLVALPARINLTITAELLSALLHGNPVAPGNPACEPTGWALAPPGAPRAPGKQSSNTAGDPAWCGAWTLTMPGGTTFAVRIEPVPSLDCDHRHESQGYQPNDTLRHLVQVRDYQCTFPSCSRHARQSDFEHARPYHKGGRTCACNAGARSRKCHRIKQSPGWDVTQQPRPGWHQWRTPAGLTYTQEPYQYPV